METLTPVPRYVQHKWDDTIDDDGSRRAKVQQLTLPVREHCE